MTTRHFICDKCASVDLVPTFAPHGHKRDHKNSELRRCCWCGLVATTKTWRRIFVAFVRIA